MKRNSAPLTLLAALAIGGCDLMPSDDGNNSADTDAAATDDGSGDDDDDDNDDDDGDDDDDDNADGESDDGDDDDDDDDDNGGGSPWDGPGPSSDPFPNAQPGADQCDGCPGAMMDTEDAETTDAFFTVDGIVANQDGAGRFVVVSESGQFLGGTVKVDDSGNFERLVPLFCGESLIKVMFGNDDGTSVFVKRVTQTQCQPADVRASLAWDETSEEWELHLVRFGGQINVIESDCFDDFYCTDNSAYVDWGVEDDHTDDPRKTVDEWLEYAGVENISYPQAEDGLTVMVENIDPDGGLTPAGTIYINVAGQPTEVRQIEVLAPHDVYTAATVDASSGTISWVEEIYDCAAEWGGDNCEADLP